jgi:hypothetical protein
MNCAYSRETVALFIEDDLPPAQVESISRHIDGCRKCQQTSEELQKSQSFIKARLSPLQTLPNAQMVAAVRQTVLSKIHDEAETFGWALKIERALMLGFRKHRYAYASAAILVILSAALLGQMLPFSPETHGRTATFEGRNTLLRPDRYREWVFVGSSLSLDYSVAHTTKKNSASESFHNVYVNPAAYREYAKNGTFPEGTVMVLEKIRSEINKGPELRGAYEKDFIALEVSVKDSNRFDGGWGFFDFTDNEGKIKPKAQALPDGTCRFCHEARAETDHVFTQFYPVLRAARMES